MAKKDEELKPGVESEVKPSAPKSESPKSNKIEVDADTLRELIEQNKQFKEDIINLQKNAVAQTPNASAMVKTGKKETLLKLRMYNGKIFLGYENVGTDKKPLFIYNEYNTQTRENIQFCNVILEGEEKPLKLDYLTFLRDSEKIWVKMKKRIELEDKVVNQGFVQKKDFADNGYGMFETMVQVPVDAIIKQYSYVVELEDGRELEVTEDCIG